jgi:hypothetical protein
MDIIKLFNEYKEHAIKAHNYTFDIIKIPIYTKVGYLK